MALFPFLPSIWKKKQKTEKKSYVAISNSASNVFFIDVLSF